jgi:hypothetical protein
MEQNPIHEYMTVHPSLSEMNHGPVNLCEKTEVVFIKKKIRGTIFSFLRKNMLYVAVISSPGRL